MKYSYIGISKPMGVVNKIIRKQLSEFRRNNPGITPPLEPGGVFASNITSASLFAGNNDMCVHYSFNDVIRDSDLIFVFLPEDSLRKVSLSIGKYDAKGKVFCHANPSACSDILDFNSYNSYCSMLVPSYFGEGIASEPFLLEGYGRNIKNFTDALNDMGFNYNMITVEEKRLYLTGVNFVSDYAHMLDEVGKKLIKLSLRDAPDVYNNVMNIIDAGKSELTSYNAIELNDRDYINKQYDLLNRVGFDNITRLFKALTDLNERF